MATVIATRNERKGNWSLPLAQGLKWLLQKIHTKVFGHEVALTVGEAIPAPQGSRPKKPVSRKRIQVLGILVYGMLTIGMTIGLFLAFGPVDRLARDLGIGMVVFSSLVGLLVFFLTKGVQVAKEGRRYDF